MNTVMKDSLQYKRSFVEQCIKAEFSNFELVDKRYSKLMKVLSYLLFFNPKFMTRFITVIGHKVYVPQLPWNKSNPYGAIEVLCHEWVHMKDAKSMGIWFKLLYLFPQIFAILALLGFWNSWFFCFLICLAPFPALWRAKLELRGYTMSMAVRWWLLKKEPNYDWYVEQFVGPNYYYMYPFPSYVRERLEEEFERIRAGQLENHEFQIKHILV